MSTFPNILQWCTLESARETKDYPPINMNTIMCYSWLGVFVFATACLHVRLVWVGCLYKCEDTHLCSNLAYCLCMTSAAGVCNIPEEHDAIVHSETLRSPCLDVTTLRWQVPRSDYRKTFQNLFIMFVFKFLPLQVCYMVSQKTTRCAYMLKTQYSMFYYNYDVHVIFSSGSMFKKGMGALVWFLP